MKLPPFLEPAQGAGARPERRLDALLGRQVARRARLAHAVPVPALHHGAHEGQLEGEAAVERGRRTEALPRHSGGGRRATGDAAEDTHLLL